MNEMTKLSAWQRELKTWRRHPVRSLSLYGLLLAWIGLVIWLRTEGIHGVAVELFGLETPSIWQQACIVALALSPLIVFAFAVRLGDAKLRRQIRARQRAHELTGFVDTEHTSPADSPCNNSDL